MKNKSRIYIRRVVQIFFFLLIGGIAVNKVLIETGQSIPFLSTASLHTLCPYGGIVTLYELFTTGAFIQKLHSSAIILMGIVFFLTVLFGPVFCGWVCPLGSIQEWIGKIGRKLFGKKYNNIVPEKLDKVMRYFRYGFLILIVYMTAKSGLLLFEKADPYYALFNFWTGEAATASIIILVLTLALSLFVERPWCKYACPYGALLGLGNLISIFKIKRNDITCINCKKCDVACPMNIKVSTSKSIRDHQCISCYECTSESSCPVIDTVNLQIGNLNSKIK